MNNKGQDHQLDKFVGKWKTEGRIVATEKSGERIITGTDTYEWLPGGFFLLHKADVQVGDDHNQTFEVIGYDKKHNSYLLRHFDNKGNSGLMVGSCIADDWTFQGDTIRFAGGFKKGNKEFSGVWEQSSDKKSWTHLMDIKLTKVDQ